ncbi:hypothetical protein VK66_20405 [Stenotrophomonas maltophilia]|nr:hypothetical protein CEQ03_05390 [Stenotrophomonas maltophilia]KOO74817.1 hypothetical protein VK66_20405 [Stenotrophomonas maltophilia]
MDLGHRGVKRLGVELLVERDLGLQLADPLPQRAQLPAIPAVASILPFARIAEVSTGHQHLLQEAAPSGW